MTGFLFNIKDMTVLTSAVIGALIGLFFLRSNSGNRPANRILGLFLLTVSSTSILSILLYVSHLVPVLGFKVPTLKMLLKAEGTLVMLEGFLLYWYTKTLLFKDFSWGRELYAHIAWMLGIACFAHFQLQTNDNDIATLLNFSMMTAGKAGVILSYELMVLTRAAYAALCFINIRRYQQLLADKYSNTDKLDLYWLKLLVSGYLITRLGHSVTMFAVLVLYYGGLQLDGCQECMTVLNTMVFDVTWLLTLSATFYFALQYSTRFEGLKERAAFTPQERVGVKPEHARRVEDYMLEHKPYLAVDLKLDDLADKVSLPSKTLSILLNAHYQKNFCEFINHYRIKEAASILSDQKLKDKQVLDIAMEVGFNSKSAFNRSFKKETGLTPQKYRQTAVAAPPYDSQGG
jgi:AraC-like DNA-binding protein